MLKPTRYLTSWIKQDLSEGKMVFLGGPRQVGKTTLALNLLGAKDVDDERYLNWDDASSRDLILRNAIPSVNELILDEIHKFSRWKTLVKGLYDKRKHRTKIIVTGSSRLDLFRKGGDSLQGRYHYFRLHPFSLGELSASSVAAQKEALKRLIRFGGFPEPFLKADERQWRRWQTERRSRLIREDVADLERVKALSLLELLAAELPSRVGSPLSVKNLRETLQVSHEACERWITILENLYYCFRIPPYGAPRIKAVKKEQKLYLWDWSQVENIGSRLENLVASHLFKFCHFIQDTQGYVMELRFLRDIQKREIDFVVLRDRKPIFAVECKSGEKEVSDSIRYFQSRASIPAFYQVHFGNRDWVHSETGTRVLPFEKFCSELELP